MMRRIITLLLTTGSLLSAHGQTPDPFARAVVDSLCSPEYWGRGYTRDGMHKAAQYIARHYALYGLRPLQTEGYFQRFHYATNTFPGQLSVRLNGRKLRPGADYLVMPESRARKGTFRLRAKDSTHFVAARTPEVLVEKVRRLTWMPSERLADHTRIQILDTTGTLVPRSLRLHIDQEYLPDFEANNVCGMVPGTRYPDSFLVVTAHYDHLGGMGRETYFPGANDNASGVALLLRLAQYYAEHPQEYSLVFIAFAGEEIGLKGSRYFTEHPLIPLSRIRFLINTDLAGTGSEGITVVNATEYPEAFERLQQINEKEQLLPAIRSRGKAANSDHYFFSELGVPAFFLYTTGGITAYHDIADRAETLPLDHQQQLFMLIRAFFEAL